MRGVCNTGVHVGVTHYVCRFRRSCACEASLTEKGDLRVSKGKHSLSCEKATQSFAELHPSPSTNARVNSMLAHNVKAAAVRTQLHGAGLTDVPSLSAMRKRKHLVLHAEAKKAATALRTKKGNPDTVTFSVEEQMRLHELASEGFIPLLQTSPHFVSVVVNMELLEIASNIVCDGIGCVFIDTTFSTCRQGVEQTELLFLFCDSDGNEVAVPFAFLLHKHKDAATYARLLDEIDTLSKRKL